VHIPPSVDEPCPLVSCQNRLGIAFIQKYHGNGNNLHSIDNPCPTIATKDQAAIVKPCFIMRDFTNGGNLSSVDHPAGSVMPFPKLNLVTPTPFIMPTGFTNTPTSIEEPLTTITANRKWHYLVNPSHCGNATSIDAPAPVVIARQDKSPLYLVVSEGGDIAIRIDESDSPAMIKIKEFMVLYSIVDIKMRMLMILELLKIQGFPENYELIGTQAEKKKFIGNAVHPLVPDAMAAALSAKLRELALKVA
jgi:DNA (cytosine-5)-methyltransferase 1